jgi:hypothetical protein
MADTICCSRSVMWRQSLALRDVARVWTGLPGKRRPQGYRPALALARSRSLLIVESKPQLNLSSNLATREIRSVDVRIRSAPEKNANCSIDVSGSDTLARNAHYVGCADGALEASIRIGGAISLPPPPQKKMKGEPFTPRGPKWMCATMGAALRFSQLSLKLMVLSSFSVASNLPSPLVKMGGTSWKPFSFATRWRRPGVSSVSPAVSVGATVKNS